MVGQRKSGPRLAGGTRQARSTGTNRAGLVEGCCCCSVRLAQIPFSSSWLPNEWRDWAGKITNAQREGGLTGVNCRLRVVTGRKRGGEIAFRTNDLGICAQPLLVRFEHRVECAFRRR